MKHSTIVYAGNCYNKVYRKKLATCCHQWHGRASLELVFTRICHVFIEFLTAVDQPFLQTRAKSGATLKPINLFCANLPAVHTWVLCMVRVCDQQGYPYSLCAYSNGTLLLTLVTKLQVYECVDCGNRRNLPVQGSGKEQLWQLTLGFVLTIISVIDC